MLEPMKLSTVSAPHCDRCFYDHGRGQVATYLYEGTYPPAFLCDEHKDSVDQEGLRRIEYVDDAEYMELREEQVKNENACRVCGRTPGSRMMPCPVCSSE